jgi:hypothetical protein
METWSRLLAVIDHVNATRELAVDDIAYGDAGRRVERSTVDELIALLAAKQVEQRGRAANAAGMRRENPFLARLHRAPRFERCVEQLGDIMAFLRRKI